MEPACLLETKREKINFHFSFKQRGPNEPHVCHPTGLSSDTQITTGPQQSRAVTLWLAVSVPLCSGSEWLGCKTSRSPGGRWIKATVRLEVWHFKIKQSGRCSCEGKQQEAREPVKSNVSAARGKENFKMEVFMDAFFKERHIVLV